MARKLITRSKNLCCLRECPGEHMLCCAWRPMLCRGPLRERFREHWLPSSKKPPLTFTEPRLTRSFERAAQKIRIIHERPTSTRGGLGACGRALWLPLGRCLSAYRRLPPRPLRTRPPSGRGASRAFEAAARKHCHALWPVSFEKNCHVATCHSTARSGVQTKTEGRSEPKNTSDFLSDSSRLHSEALLHFVGSFLSLHKPAQTKITVLIVFLDFIGSACLKIR